MLVLILIAATLLALTSWLTQRDTSPPPPDSEAVARLPDYFIRGMQATVTDESGTPTHQLIANSMIHLPGRKVTELEQPRLTVLEQGQTRWFVRADEGEAFADDRLALQGDVRLEQRGKETLLVQTQHLNIDTPRRYAETDAAVTLTESDSRIEGIGMEAFARTKQLRLLKAVRGNYATP